MSALKTHISIGPESLSEHLTKEEMKTLLNIIDKLFVNDVQLSIIYTPIKAPLPKSLADTLQELAVKK